MATAGVGDAVHPAPIPGLPVYIDPLSVIGLAGGPDLEVRGHTRTQQLSLARAATPPRTGPAPQGYLGRAFY